jgi:hypothetical protein
MSVIAPALTMPDLKKEISLGIDYSAMQACQTIFSIKKV